ncbi:MAG: hypothetical protein FWH29_02870 [Methanobrevibacter sp.]|nr:hypothetical protein [Methanobrevibacter sp.]
MPVTSIKLIIDPKLLKTISEIAKGENTTENEFINNIIKKEIKKIQNETLEERIKRLGNGNIKILNKEQYNPNEEDLDKMIGLFEAKEPFDSVEEMKKIERGEDV